VREQARPLPPPWRRQLRRVLSAVRRRVPAPVAGALRRRRATEDDAAEPRARAWLRSWQQDVSGRVLAVGALAECFVGSGGAGQARTAEPEGLGDALADGAVDCLVVTADEVPLRLPDVLPTALRPGGVLLLVTRGPAEDVVALLVELFGAPCVEQQVHDLPGTRPGRLVTVRALRPLPRALSSPVDAPPPASPPAAR
jgi:hypothetical protein